MISNQETLILSQDMGYDTASTTGLFGMEIQGETTIIVVNLK